MMQRAFFKRQLQIAAMLGRPASIHCVKAMGPLLEVLKELIAEAAESSSGTALPPTIAFHSFSGTACQVTDILQLQGNRVSKKGSRKAPTVAAHESASMTKFFFGFSYTINVLMNGNKGVEKLHEAIRRVPDDQLLLESDESGSFSSCLEATRRAAVLVARAKEWTLAKTAKQTSENGSRFLQIIEDAKEL